MLWNRKSNNNSRRRRCGNVKAAGDHITGDS
jgi:hypothetical protein